MPDATETGKKGGAGEFTCSQCGRGFAMKMHLARHQAAAHGIPGKRSAKAKAKVKAKAKGNAKAKASVKPANGRRRRGRKPGPKPGARRVVTAPAVAAAAATINVAGLSVEQLLTVKTQVDNRLAAIAQQMRKANVKV